MRNSILARALLWVTFGVVCASGVVCAQQPALVEVASRDITLFGMDFTKDGAALVIGGSHGLWVYSMKSDQITQREPGRVVRQVACSPTDSELFVTFCGDNKLRLRRVGSQQPLWELETQPGFLMDLVFFPDGKLLAVSGVHMQDGKKASSYVGIIDSATGKIVHRIEKQTDLSGLAVSSDAQQLAVCVLARKGSSVEIYDRAQGWNVQHDIAIPNGFANAVTFIDDGKSLVLAGGKFFGPDADPQRDARSWVANLSDGDYSIKQLSVHDIDSYRGLAWNQIGNRFAASTNEGRSQYRLRPNKQNPNLPPVPVETSWQLITVVHMRDIKNGKLLWSADGNNAADIGSLTMTPAQKQVVFCSSGTVFFVDAESGEIANTLKPPSEK